jgi:hypothetical protein
MKTFIISILLIFTLGTVIHSCKKKNTTPAASYTPSCNGSTPSFSITVKPLFQSYCVSCHSNYSSYAQISGSASSIRSTIVNGSMPKGTTLSEEQKNNIVCWIDAGKPNN